MKIKFLPNKVIKFLILSDMAFWFGWGLINPIFAVFVLERIKGGNVFTVGIAVAIYSFTAALLRLPIGIILDSFPSEKDDYFALVAGLFIASLIPFGYIFIEIPLHLYILQAILGIGMAMALSGWTAIFTRHIDKGEEATEWSLDATSIGLVTATSSFIGGWTVSKFGFIPVLIWVGVFGLTGALLLLGLKNEIKGVFNHGLYFSLKDIFKKE